MDGIASGHLGGRELSTADSPEDSRLLGQDFLVKLGRTCGLQSWELRGFALKMQRNVSEDSNILSFNDHSMSSESTQKTSGGRPELDNLILDELASFWRKLRSCWSSP